jgi:hypothetical protein
MDSTLEFSMVLWNNHLSREYPMRFSFIIDIFSLPGELISPQSLRCSPGRLGRLEVVHYIFIGHCLHLFERVGWVGGGVGWFSS